MRYTSFDFPGGSDVKVSAYNSGDPVSIPGSGRSPGEGNGNPLQYSSLGNPMNRGAQWATVHGVAKSQTQLINQTHTHTHTHDYFKSCIDVQFSSVTQSCLTLCNSMNHSTPGLPVHHQLPEFTQTHVHRVDDAIRY